LAVVLLLCVPALAQPDAVKQDLKEVDDRADKPFEQYERESAMRRLGESGDPAAFAKLVSLLNDDFVSIRTSAQRILVSAKGDAGSVLVRDGLTHKQAEVRRRSATVLGKRKDAAATKPLANLLKGEKDESVRVACVHALGAVAAGFGKDWAGDKELSSALERALKGNDAPAGAAALQLGQLGAVQYAARIAELAKGKSAESAIGGCDGLAALGVAAEHLEALAKAAAAKDWRVRIAAAQALCSVRQDGHDDALRESLAALLADSDWRVRRRCIESLVDLWRPLSADLLAARIGKESSVLALDIAHALEDLTGTRQGYLPEAWSRWWESSGRAKGLVARRERPAQGWLRPPRPGSVDAGGSGATATYFDIPVFAQPTAYVFDMSGSMRDPVSRDNSKIRSVLAREELARTLKASPAGTSFNLVIYRYYSEFPVRTEVLRAFSAAQPLGPKTLESADKWIAGQQAFGWGAFYEGLVAAMADPAVQVIQFLSDGAPSRGEFTDREELIEALGVVRRFAPVVVNAVLVGGARRDEDFMRDMATNCGGSFADARTRR